MVLKIKKIDAKYQNFVEELDMKRDEVIFLRKMIEELSENILIEKNHYDLEVKNYTHQLKESNYFKIFFLLCYYINI